MNFDLQKMNHQARHLPQQNTCAILAIETSQVVDQAYFNHLPLAD
jgi:hypothetical protein